MKMKSIVMVGLLLVASAASAETRKFNMFTVEASGVKMWVPSTIVVKRGDEVEINATSKVGAGDKSMHGFTIDEYKVVETATDKGKTIKFTADKPGVFSIRCHLHPAHLGAQLVVLE